MNDSFSLRVSYFPKQAFWASGHYLQHHQVRRLSCTPKTATSKQTREGDTWFLGRAA